jgi:hypothetical protein
MDGSFSTKFTTRLSPAEVINGITHVNGWWATNVTGNTKNLDDIFTVRFGKTFSTIKVIEVVRDKKLVWLVTDCDLPLFQNPKDWLNTKLLWELNRDENETEVKFTHEGLTPGKSCYEDCNKGWTYYICESLRKLITDGKGMPGTGIFAYIIINERRYEGLLYYKNDPIPQYQDGLIYLDVLETRGEQVTKIHQAKDYAKNFDGETLQGEYFMILANKSIELPQFFDSAVLEK